MIDATAPVTVAAVLLIQEKVREVCSYEQRLAGKRPVAAVHDMRVASRRLREALSLFQQWLDPSAHRELQRYGRRVTRALGPVRNTDVTMRFFRRLRKELNDAVECRAIQRILARVSRSRRRQRKAMLAKIRRLRLKRLRRDIDTFLAVPEVGESNFQPMLHEVARPLLHERLECAFQYEPIVRDESKVEELHAMRIAFKRVRYALEIMEPAFDKEHRRILERLVGYQERLGKIHDLDIFVEDLQWLSARWRRKRKRPRLRAALDTVVKRLIQRRHDLFIEFYDYLDEHDSVALLQACDTSLQARV